MNTYKNQDKTDSVTTEVMLGRNASLFTVLAITVLAAASVSLIDKRTQGLNVGAIDSLTTEDHFRQAIQAIHARHTPDVIMHRNALSQLDGPAEQIKLLNAFTQAMADDVQAAAESIQELKDSTDKTISTYIYYIAGEMAFRQKNYTVAIGYLQQAIQLGDDLDPPCLPAYQLMASLHYDQGNMQHAMDAATRVSEINPDNAQIYRFMGMIQQDYEQWEDAKNAYRTCLEKDPYADYRDTVLIGLGQISLKLREYAQAKSYLQQAVATPQVWALRAESEFNLGNLGVALELLKQSLDTNPQQRDAILLKGTIQVQDKQYNDAITALLEGLEYHPKDDQLMYKLAEAYRGVSDNENAEKYIAMSEELRQKRERFSKLNTDAIAEPTNVEMRLELGKLAEEIGKPELAIGWYQAVLQLDPTREEAAKSANRILVQQSGGTVTEEATQVPFAPQTPVLPNGASDSNTQLPVLVPTTPQNVPVLPKNEGKDE